MTENRSRLSVVVGDKKIRFAEIENCEAPVMKTSDELERGVYEA